MSQKSISLKDGAEMAVRDIRRKTRKQYSAEETIRIVLSSLRGEDSIADLCRRQIVELALEEPELSPRELVVTFTDTRSYFVSEASV